MVNKLEDIEHTNENDRKREMGKGKEGKWREGKEREGEERREEGRGEKEKEGKENADGGINMKENPAATSSETIQVWDL